jgi:hypothetical protein
MVSQDGPYPAASTRAAGISQHKHLLVHVVMLQQVLVTVLVPLCQQVLATVLVPLHQQARNSIVAEVAVVMTAEITHHVCFDADLPSNSALFGASATAAYETGVAVGAVGHSN